MRLPRGRALALLGLLGVSVAGWVLIRNQSVKPPAQPQLTRNENRPKWPSPPQHEPLPFDAVLKGAGRYVTRVNALDTKKSGYGKFQIKLGAELSDAGHAESPVYYRTWIRSKENAGGAAGGSVGGPWRLLGGWSDQPVAKASIKPGEYEVAVEATANPEDGPQRSVFAGTLSEDAG